MTPEEFQKKNDQAIRKAELANLEPISFEELENTVRKWMIVPDTGIIKLLCGLYVANSLSRKAVWTFIIGPSGGGKTEFLNGLLDLPNIYEISMITPNTFLSGMPGKNDASLLPKVNGKIMLFKDWTSILSMNKDARGEIMGQLREIWDGHMRKQFGNGRSAEWEGKVSIIAASTQVVDIAQQQHTALGERFIHYRIRMPNRKDVAMRSLNNDDHQQEMGKEIRNAFYAFFKGIDLINLKELPQLPEDIKKELVDIADLSSMARSGVIREFGFKKEVIFVPSAEMPTRIVQQLNTIASGFVLVNGGKYKEEDMAIIYKLALDSIPQTNKMVMIEMARADNRDTAQIATSLGYPTAPIRMYLENLAMLGVCKRIKADNLDELEDNGTGSGDRWCMKKEYVDILKRYEKIEELEKEIVTEIEVTQIFDNLEEDLVEEPHIDNGLGI